MKRTILAAAAAVVVALAPAAAQAPPAGVPPGSQMLVPAPGPAIGGGQVGSPTYVVPAPPPQEGGIINVGAITGSPVVQEFVNDVVNLLVASAMGWLFWLLKSKLNVNIDAEHRDALTQAAQRQASSLVADGMVSLQGKTIAVNDKALFDAVNHLGAAAPDAIKRFGVTPQALADRIVDMIPQVPAIAPAVAAAHADGAAPPTPQQEKPS